MLGFRAGNHYVVIPLSTPLSCASLTEFGQPHTQHISDSLLWSKHITFTFWFLLCASDMISPQYDGRIRGATERLGCCCIKPLFALLVCVSFVEGLKVYRKSTVYLTNYLSFEILNGTVPFLRVSEI